MKYKRKFIIKIKKDESTDIDGYIKEIFKNSIGYFFEITYKLENAKIWKYKKNAERAISVLEESLDPTKPNLKKYSYEVFEITDNQVLRSIKLYKIKKNENF